MERNVLRQIKDIQYQAEKLFNESPNANEIEDFSRYSKELKNYIQENFEIPEVTKLINEIPDIPGNKVTIKKGIFSLLIPNVLLYWYYERNYVEKSKPQINIAKGKFASIEFILKNYF